MLWSRFVIFVFEPTPVSERNAGPGWVILVLLLAEGCSCRERVAFTALLA